MSFSKRYMIIFYCNAKCVCSIGCGDFYDLCMCNNSLDVTLLNSHVFFNFDRFLFANLSLFCFLCCSDNIKEY